MGHRKEMSPIRTLYVDSSYAEVDAAGGRFKPSFPDAIKVPDGTRAYVDDCIFPYSWQTLMTGENDRVYLVTETRDGVYWSGTWTYVDPNLTPSQELMAGEWSEGDNIWSIEKQSILDGFPAPAGSFLITGVGSTELTRNADNEYARTGSTQVLNILTTAPMSSR